MTYSERLARELATAGIGGARRRRIIAEIEDHLACDSGAQFGDPAALARQFAGPFDGLARGLADALACIAGYALLGGYLGLRRRAVRGR